MCKKILFIFFLFVISNFCVVFAQIPTGYYNNANGKRGYALQAALCGIIDSHRVVTYSSLWTYFGQTDLKPNGKIWDIYSDGAPYEFDFPANQCLSTGASEGVCYNREHMFCQTWFGKGTGSPYSDLFHIYPVDGLINSKRNNNPYGEIQTPTQTFLNGSKFGKNDYPGSPLTNAFEPVDEYKGDIARSLLYMSVRYMFEDNNFVNYEMNLKSQFQPWALQMLKEWHAVDPVSQKETDRNNAIYAIQRNRNPFIDYPELVGFIFGEDSIHPFNVAIMPVPELPEVDYFSVESDTTLKVTFNMDVIATTAQNLASYFINGGLTIKNVLFEQDTVTITLNNPAGQGINYSLLVRNIQSTDFYYNKDTIFPFIFGEPVEHTPIVAWTFDDTPAKPSTPTVIQPEINTLPELPAFVYCDGTHGSSEFISSASTTNEINTYTGTIEGDPRGATALAGKALTIENQSANDKAMVIQFPTKGWKSIVVTFACQKTSTGFNQHEWEWSIDGENYAALPHINTVPDVNSAFKLQAIDLQSLDDVSNQDSVFLRVTLSGATGNTGNNRFDNVVVKGIAYNTAIRQFPTDDFKVFPNPSTGSFEIRLTDSNLQVSELHLLDVNGKLLKREKFEGESTLLNMHAYAAGTYFVVIQTKSGQKSGAKKIVLTK